MCRVNCCNLSASKKINCEDNKDAKLLTVMNLGAGNFSVQLTGLSVMFGHQEAVHCKQPGVLKNIHH